MAMRDGKVLAEPGSAEFVTREQYDPINVAACPPFGVNSNAYQI